MRECIHRPRADRLAELVDGLEASRQATDGDPSTGDRDSSEPNLLSVAAIPGTIRWCTTRTRSQAVTGAVREPATRPPVSRCAA